MSDILTPELGADTTTLTAQATAIAKKPTKDFMDFLDTSKDVFYAYLYHRTGSEKIAKTLLGEIYFEVLSRTLSLWWFGTLSLKLLFRYADRAIGLQSSAGAADIDTVYLPNLVWLTDKERACVSTLHDALWTLPVESQQLLILSILIGLPQARVAEILEISIEEVAKNIPLATSALLERWQPTPDVQQKLQSLVFAPSLDSQGEGVLRLQLTEKYNGMRFRRYQWVIIGGLFAVLSNVIVASVLAFAVITQPPTSLLGTRTEVASLDAVLLKRELELSEAKQHVANSIREAQGIASYSVTRDLSGLGLTTVREFMHTKKEKEVEIQRLKTVIERARTAFIPLAKFVAAVARHNLRLF